VVLRTCIVSFIGPAAIRDSVALTAETLYASAALAVSVLRKADWSEPITSATRIEVQVRKPVTTHPLTAAMFRVSELLARS